MFRFSVFCLSMILMINAYSQQAGVTKIEGMPSPTQPAPTTSSPLEYTNIAPQPQTTTQATSNADNFIKKLITESGCAPMGDKKCEITVKSVNDIPQYLYHCGALSGWLIHFAHSSVLNITLIGGGDVCKVEFTDTHFPNSPQTISCNFTQDQIRQMYTELAKGDELANYEKTHQSNANLLLKVKPVADCLNPLGQMQNIQKNPNVEVAPANAQILNQPVNPVPQGSTPNATP